MNYEYGPVFAWLQAWLQTFEWLQAHPIALAAIIVWITAWKGFALWKAAGLRQKYWFIAILVLNTIGILEIIYLFVVSRKYKVEVIEKTQE